ncbi:hypothetical protein BY458DRAFT_556452 [Sporodiniella umbellata]|nr:hypothetical protein BY458DRAFT_556452 [Sporodiniella umbellata]
MPKRKRPLAGSMNEQDEEDELEEHSASPERNTDLKKRKKIVENNRAEFESSDNREGLGLQELKAQMELTTNEMKRMKQTVDELIGQVTGLKGTLLDVKDLLQSHRSHPLPPPPPLPSMDDVLIPPKFAPLQGPFRRFSQMDRTLPRPSAKEVAETLGGKEHSLQFTSNLYVDLIEKVLGPQQDNRQLDYKAMVKEAILLTKAVVSHVKETHQIDPETRWSYIDPTVKLETYRILESATEHLLPLKICLEYWGAHVLISNFWVKRKKYEKETKVLKKRLDPFSIPFLTNQ